MVCLVKKYVKLTFSTSLENFDMRFIGFCLMAIGGLLLFVFLAAKGRDAYESTQIFLTGLLGCGACFAGWKLFWLQDTRQELAENELSSLPELQAADYKHVFNTSAIALNKSNQTLFLVDGTARKNYAFEDIRKWNYTFLTGGRVVGGGLQHGAFNQQVNQANRDGSGFFVEVRDIDHPKWHIKFQHDSKAETELLRWMEILRQNINEGEDDEDKLIEVMSSWKFDINSNPWAKQKWASLSDKKREALQIKIAALSFEKNAAQWAEYDKTGNV